MRDTNGPDSPAIKSADVRVAEPKTGARPPGR